MNLRYWLMPILATIATACSSAPTNPEAEAVSATMHARRDSFVACYNNYRRGISLPFAGKITAHFDIGTFGNVTRARIEEKEVPEPLQACLLRTLRATKFAPHENPTGIVEVRFPFVFGVTP